MPSRVRMHTRMDGTMSVECWCRQAIVYVDPEVVRRGETGSCGATECNPSLCRW